MDRHDLRRTQPCRLGKRVGDSSRSRPARERPSDQVSDNRHRQQWTPADTYGRDGPPQAARAATLAARAATWLRDEQAACTANLAVGVYRAMAILLLLLVRAIASPIGAPCGSRFLPRLGEGMEGRVGKKKNIFLVWLVWLLITLGIHFFLRLVLQGESRSPGF